MLIRITEFAHVDERKLMDVYMEGNTDNALYFYPNEERSRGIAMAERDFMDFLEKVFFKNGNEYWVLSVGGDWVSALRLSHIKGGTYYLEALETRPDSRKKGYAAKLLSAVINVLKGQGDFEIYDCVGKNNVASISTHVKCGFEKYDDGVDLLRNEIDTSCYGMRYVYKANK